MLASLAIGQVEVSTSIGFKVDGLTDPVMIGGDIVSKTPAKASTPVGFVEVKTEAAMVAVTITEQATRNAVEVLEVGKGLYSWKQPGKVEILVEALDFDKRIWKKITAIAELPGSSPGPGPGPGPTPAPDKIADLSCLIVYESADLPAYTVGQRNVINSTDLMLNCRNTIGGRYAVLDQHTVFPDKCDTVWCKWLAKPPPELPWIIIGNKEKQVYAGKLPSDPEEVKKLIAKHSGSGKVVK